MGSACCVAARDKTIVHGPTGEVISRNHRYSPTWSFRWDNRGRVAGEETSIHWFSDGISRNGDSDIKFESAYPSEDGSPMGSFQRHKWQKSPISEGTAARVCTPASDRSISRTISMDRNLQQAKESVESPAATNSSPGKQSPSLSSASSLSPPLQLPQSHLPSTDTPRLPNHQFELIPPVSDSQSLDLKSSSSVPVVEDKTAISSWSNNSTRGSGGGSSDGWSMNAFSELMINSYRESFDNDLLAFNHEKMAFDDQMSAYPHCDTKRCGTCSKPLTERSFFSSRKLVVNNELPVVAVLTCGHVYHAECLESLALNVDKYDPSCPICTLGKKQTFKLSKKALKAEMEMKARSKKSRKRIVDNDLDVDTIMLDRLKCYSNKGQDYGISSTSSSNTKNAKPFLRRHFSFGSKVSSSSTENDTTRKKGWFWSRSMKA